jgi:hypothetical protein
VAHSDKELLICRTVEQEVQPNAGNAAAANRLHHAAVWQCFFENERVDSLAIEEAHAH